MSRHLVLAAIVAAAFSAQAEDAGSSTLGPDARAWTGLQVSGQAASPAERPLPGDIAEKTYERYANSFAQPIPEALRRDSFSTSGGSSSGSK